MFMPYLQRRRSCTTLVPHEFRDQVLPFFGYSWEQLTPVLFGVLVELHFAPVWELGCLL